MKLSALLGSCGGCTTVVPKPASPSASTVKLLSSTFILSFGVGWTKPNLNVVLASGS